MRLDIEHAIRVTMPPAEAEIVISELDRLRQQNAEFIGILKKHESRIRYAHEIGSEVLIYGDDLEEILAAISKYEQETTASQ